MTLRIATCLTVALVSVACGGAEITDEINPPSATPEQVAAFCDRLDEVRDREIGAMFEALLDLAPPELGAALTRLTGPRRDLLGRSRDRRGLHGTV